MFDYPFYAISFCVNDSAVDVYLNDLKNLDRYDHNLKLDSMIIKILFIRLKLTVVISILLYQVKYIALDMSFFLLYKIFNTIAKNIYF